MNQRIAVVPARGGSERLPNKNLRMLRGEPLVAHALRHSLEAEKVDEVVLTSEDERILDVARSLGGVTIVERPASLAGNRSRSVDAVLHALASVDAEASDIVVLVQPTSPLRTPEDIDACVSLLSPKGVEAGSVVSVCRASHHPYKCLIEKGDALGPVRTWDDFGAPDQELPEALVTNGAVYVITVGRLRASQRFLVPAVTPYRMPLDRSIDIDTLQDLNDAEEALKYAS